MGGCGGLDVWTAEPPYPPELTLWGLEPEKIKTNMLNSMHVRTWITVHRSGARGELWELCRDPEQCWPWASGEAPVRSGCPLHFAFLAWVWWGCNWCWHWAGKMSPWNSSLFKDCSCFLLFLYLFYMFTYECAWRPVCMCFLLSCPFAGTRGGAPRRGENMIPGGLAGIWGEHFALVFIIPWTAFPLHTDRSVLVLKGAQGTPAHGCGTTLSWPAFGMLLIPLGSPLGSVGMLSCFPQLGGICCALVKPFTHTTCCQCSDKDDFLADRYPHR